MKGVYAKRHQLQSNSPDRVCPGHGLSILPVPMGPRLWSRAHRHACVFVIRQETRIVSVAAIKSLEFDPRTNSERNIPGVLDSSPTRVFGISFH